MTQADNERPRHDDARPEVVDPTGTTRNVAWHRGGRGWIAAAVIAIVVVVVFVAIF